MKKKLMIVIEENGEYGGKGFNIYLDGDKEGLSKLKEEEMSPAQFWAYKLFKICTQLVTQTGALKNVKTKVNK